MATDRPEMPRTPTGNEEKPSRREVVPRRDADTKDRPRHAGDESGTHGDRMPLGADEPGAGL